MATNYGLNLEKFLKPPKAPSSSAAQSGFKVSYGSKPKAPTAKHLSTRSTLPKVPGGSGAGSSSSSSPIFASSAHHVFSSSKVEGEFSGIKFPKPATPEQRMWLKQQAKNKQSHSSGGISGFLGSAFNNPVGHYLGEGLNLLGRPAHATAAFAHATSHETNWRNAFGLGKGLHAAAQELEGHGTIHSHGQTSHATFWDLYNGNTGNTLGHRIAESSPTAHKLMHGFAFGSDITIDPLNLVGGAGVWAKAGEKGFQVTRGLSELDKAAHAAGHMADLTKYEHYANMAKDIAPQLSNRMLEHLASMRNKGYHLLDSVPAHLSEEHLADTQKLNMLSRTLQAEAKSNMSRYLGIRLGSKANGFTLKTPIKTGDTLARRLAKAEHGNVLQRGVRQAAAGFKPGYLDPIGHSLQLTARHMGERLTVQTWHKVWQALKGHKHLGARGREDVMAAVTHKAGIVDPVTHELNVHALDKALRDAGYEGKKLTEAKAFVKDWHTVTEHLRVADQRAGVEYKVEGPADQLYVPHVFEKKTGTRYVVSKSMLSKAGHELHGQDMTYQQILGLERAGGKKGGNYVTDPLELIAHRIQKGAKGQTHAMIRSTIRETWGKASHHTSEDIQKEAHAPLEPLHAQRRATEALGEASHGRKANQIMNAGRAKAKAYRDITERQFVSKSKSLKIEQQFRKDGDVMAREARYAEAAKANQVVSKSRGHEIEQQYKDAVSSAHMQHSRTMDKTAKDLGALDQEIAAATRKAANDSWVAHPNSEMAGHVEMKSLAHKIPGTDKMMHYSVPKEIAPQVENVERFMVDPGFSNSVMRSMAKAMSIWKLGVTVVNPGYRVRNTMSDLWNMFVSGVPAPMLPVYMSKAAKFQAQIKIATEKLARGESLNGGELKTVRVANEMHDHGILSGQFLGDIAKVTKRLESGSKVRKVFRAPLVANIHAENNTRIAHFLYRLDHGYSIAGAAEQVRIAHFDYEDLTPMEQKLKGVAIPFYTWTRKNVPYQLKMLAENPAKFVHFMQTAQASEQASGASPHDVIGTALDFAPTAFKAGPGYLNAQLGLNDVINAGDPKQELGGLLGPQFKVPIELATGRNLTTGQAMSGPDAAHQRTPAPGWLSSLLGGGQTTRLGPDGKPISGPGISNTEAYIAQQLPMSGMILGQNPIDEANHPGHQRLLQYLTGVGYIQPQEGREKVIAAVKNSNAEKAYFKGLRDSGKLPQASHKKSKSPYQAQLDKYIQGSISRGR